MPKERKIYYVGAEKVNNAGQLLRICALRNCRDFDVQFEDGTIKKHCEMSAWRKGQILNPNLPRPYIRKSSNGTFDTRAEAQRHIGQEAVMNNGLTVRCIAYRGFKDADFQFVEDGTVVKNVPYRNFQRRSISNPNVSVKVLKLAKEREGKIRVNNDGHKIELIKYADNDHCTVRRDDGLETVVDYGRFNKGQVCFIKPGDHIGETVRTRCGLMAEVKYNSHASRKNLTVRFEDGETVSGKDWNNVKNGTVKHPVLSSQKHFIGYHGFNGGFAFREDNGEVYYRCQCSICKIDDILTPMQMIQHEQELHKAA